MRLINAAGSEIVRLASGVVTTIRVA